MTEDWLRLSEPRIQGDEEYMAAMMKLKMEGMVNEEVLKRKGTGDTC